MAFVESIQGNSNNLTVQQLCNYLQRYHTGNNKSYMRAVQIIRFVQDLYTDWISDEDVRRVVSTAMNGNNYNLSGNFVFGEQDFADHFQFKVGTLGGSIVTVTDPHFKNDRNLYITIQFASEKYYNSVRTVIKRLETSDRTQASIVYHQLEAHGPEAFKVIMRTNDCKDLIGFLAYIRG